MLSISKDDLIRLRSNYNPIINNIKERKDKHLSFRRTLHIRIIRIRGALKMIETMALQFLFYICIASAITLATLILIKE